MAEKRSPLIEVLENPVSPVDLFRKFVNEPYCFFLDSSMDPEKLGRYSFIGANPFLILKSFDDSTEIITSERKSVEFGNPLDILNKYLEEYKLDESDVPFTGGAAGYISYDICHFIEKLPKTAVNDLELPVSYFGFYDVIVAHDNLTGETSIISTGFPEKDEELRLERAATRLREMKEFLDKSDCSPKPSEPVPEKSAARKSLKSNFSHEDYLTAVERSRQYIIDGDIFEINISQRFETTIDMPPWELYVRLREINPAPFAAYLDFNDVVIVSASPERFIRGTGDRVETRPIKGTIRRGRTPEEDLANAEFLIGSEKNHAENMMIVDLERNDLGRVCRFGTVKVTELAILETFPTVYHLTSTVVGQLREENGRIELLKATLPGGSITGAPKIRSMEIIDELEPTCRSVYTGNIGYLSFNGNMDLNIVIRTFLLKGNKAYFQAGGAIVYDSEPESEYQETIDKVRALMDALDLTI